MSDMIREEDLPSTALSCSECFETPRSPPKPSLAKLTPPETLGRISASQRLSAQCHRYHNLWQYFSTMIFLQGQQGRWGFKTIWQAKRAANSRVQAPNLPLGSLKDFDRI